MISRLSSLHALDVAMDSTGITTHSSFCIFSATWEGILLQGKRLFIIRTANLCSFLKNQSPNLIPDKNLMEGNLFVKMSKNLVFGV